MRRVLLTFTLLVASAGLTLAQNPGPPDFSGTWVLNVAKSKPNLKGFSDTIVITVSGSNVTMRHTTNGKEWAHTYVTDGTEHVLITKGVERKGNVDKAYWKKSTLIAEMTGRLPDGTEVLREKAKWTLSADGRVLTEESEGVSLSPEFRIPTDESEVLDRKTVSVYDKQ
jgi:hypothetical protein